MDAEVAFANTDGGELYLGVEDTGEISGLQKDHMDITRLAAFIANKTVPSVPVRCEILDFALPILKITVPRRTSITASSSGKIQRRRLKANGEPENVPMYPYEIAGRLSDLSLFDYSAQPVPNGEYRDLDPAERERLRRIIRDYHGGSLLYGRLLPDCSQSTDSSVRLFIPGGLPGKAFAGMISGELRHASPRSPQVSQHKNNKPILRIETKAPTNFS